MQKYQGTITTKFKKCHIDIWWIKDHYLVVYCSFVGSQGTTSPFSLIFKTGTIECAQTPHVFPCPIVKYPQLPQLFPQEFRTIHQFFQVWPTIVIAWFQPNLLQSVKVPFVYLLRSPALIMAATTLFFTSQLWIAWQFPGGNFLNPDILYNFFALFIVCLSHLNDQPVMDRQGYSSVVTSPVFITYSKPFVMFPSLQPLAFQSSWAQSMSCCSESFTVMLQQYLYIYSTVAAIGNEQHDAHSNWSTGSEKYSVKLIVWSKLVSSIIGPSSSFSFGVLVNSSPS